MKLTINLTSDSRSITKRYEIGSTLAILSAVKDFIYCLNKPDKGVKSW